MRINICKSCGRQSVTSKLHHRHLRPCLHSLLRCYLSNEVLNNNHKLCQINLEGVLNLTEYYSVLNSSLSEEIIFFNRFEDRDKAMAYIDGHNSRLIGRLPNWLLCRDKEMVHIGMICLGNISRTHANSVIIVRKGIHNRLFRVVQRHRRDVRLLYAAVSTLRNLSVPQENRKRLVDDGLVDVLVPLLDSSFKTTSPVIYKTAAAIRLAIEGRGDISLGLGFDISFVRQLVTWATATLLPWVAAECSRFMCSLVTATKNRIVIMNMLETGAYTYMSKMLTAVHEAIQSEVLACLIITINVARQEARSDDVRHLTGEEKERSDRLINFENVLLECLVPEKLMYLITQHGSDMDVSILELCFIFVLQLLKYERVRGRLYELKFCATLDYTMRSREDYHDIKDRVTEIENACKFY